MRTFNSFQELHSAQSTMTGNFFAFANNVEFKDVTSNSTATVKNVGYSEQEKQKHAAMCTKELNAIEREILKLDREIAAIKKIPNPRRRNMQRPEPYYFQPGQTAYLPKQPSQGQLADKLDQREGYNIRTNALRSRLKEIRDTDTAGQFVVRCNTIEEKLDKFQTQIAQATDKPISAPVIPPKISNCSLNQCFQ